VSDDIIPENLSTIPDELAGEPIKEPLKQAIVRIHENDHRVLKVLLKKDRLSFQKLVNYCVRAYLDGDPYLLKVVKNYRELEAIPRDVKDKHVLSHRERSSLYDELEAAEKESKG